MFAAISSHCRTASGGVGLLGVACAADTPTGSIAIEPANSVVVTNRAVLIVDLPVSRLRATVEDEMTAVPPGEEHARDFPGPFLPWKTHPAALVVSR